MVEPVELGLLALIVVRTIFGERIVVASRDRHG
jgi:hypothetical protein